VFFASDGLSMQVEVSDGMLVAPNCRIRERMAMTSKTDGDIAPRYDAYVVCGLGLSSIRAIRTVSPTMAARRDAGLKTPATVEDIARGMEPPLRGAIAIDVISKLRQLTQNPILLIATPLSAHERHPEIWGPMDARNRVDFAAAAYHAACRRIAREYDAVFVPQPAQTVGPNALTTRPEFYRSPPEQAKLEKDHHAHMNCAFGAIVLRDILQRISALLARHDAFVEPMANRPSAPSSCPS
jgi:hypothetical protein